MHIIHKGKKFSSTLRENVQLVDKLLRHNNRKRTEQNHLFGIYITKLNKNARKQIENLSLSGQ